MKAGRARGWGPALLLLACGVFAATQIGKLPPAIPALREAFGSTLLELGWLASIFNAIAAACGLIAGWVADRLGRRVLLKIGLVALGVGALGGAMADSLAWLYPTRVLEGLGFLCIVVSAPALVREVVGPANQRLALGIWSCYTSVGMAVMLLLSPVLLATFGWRSGWWLGACGAAAFAAAALLVFPGRGAVLPPAQGSPGLFHGLGDAVPWCLAACFGLYTLQWMALAVWMPTFLLDTAGLSLASTAAVVALMVFVNAPGNVLGGWLSQRRWPLLVLVLVPAVAMGILGWAVYALPMPLEARVALCVAFSLTGGVLPASIYAAVPAVAARHDNLGAVNGLVVQASNLGTLAGPPLAAWLVTVGGWRAMAPLFLVTSVISVALAVWAVRAVGARSSPCVGAPADQAST